MVICVNGKIPRKRDPWQEMDTSIKENIHVQQNQGKWGDRAIRC